MFFERNKHGTFFKTTKYGCYFSVGPSGIWIMLNGRMYSYSKGLNSGKWHYSRWDNIWRKEDEEAPYPRKRRIAYTYNY